MREELAVLKDPNVWKLSQYYSIVFGGYVGLSLWMTKYYVGEYGFELNRRRCSPRASLPGGVLRAIGGWMSDKWGAHPVTWWVMLISFVCLFFLSYPQTDLVVRTTRGELSFHFGLGIYVFTTLMFVMGIAWAVGKASVFKYISDEYTHNIGVISGIAGLAGGLGGFLLPIMFGALLDVTGVPRAPSCCSGHHAGLARLDVLDRDRAAQTTGPQRCTRRRNPPKENNAWVPYCRE